MKNCYYHIEQTLFNFCSNKQCALPLCPKCINIHLNQASQVKHHIQSLQETRQMIYEQLCTSTQAISHQLISLTEGQYKPQVCLKQYQEMLQKYRQQAIRQINQHYDQLKSELFKQIKSKFDRTLNILITPLKQKQVELLNFQKELQQRPLECFIKIVSQDFISNVQKFLLQIQDKKQTFKNYLPRLEGIEGGKLKMIPVNQFVQRNLTAAFQASNRRQIQSSGVNIRVLQNQLQETNRILQLQQRLLRLKGNNPVFY